MSKAKLNPNPIETTVTSNKENDNTSLHRDLPETPEILYVSKQKYDNDIKDLKEENDRLKDKLKYSLLETQGWICILTANLHRFEKALKSMEVEDDN